MSTVFISLSGPRSVSNGRRRFGFGFVAMANGKEAVYDAREEK